MNDDIALLRRYAENRDENAFAELVRRHLALVYGAAMRQLGGATHRSEEVAQSVFTDLAQKAESVARRTDIVGWLYTSTHFAAAKLKRSEQRRQGREQEAHLMNELLSDSAKDAAWERMRPVLDEAMNELGERDRDVILQRFFQGRRLADVGARLGLSEDAARMRVDRALEKLRASLARRQITSTTAALGVALASQPAVAVPAGLAAAVTGAALASAPVAMGTAAAAGGLLSFMGTTKIMVGTVAVLGLVSLGVAIYETGAARRASSAARAGDEARAGFAARKTRASANKGSEANAPTRLDERQKEGTEAQSQALPGARSASEPALAGKSTERPPAEKALVQKEREKLHRRYDPFLLQQRGLTPAQADRFVELKLLKARDREDFQAAVASQGLNGRSDEVMALRGKLGAPLDREMREILGDEGMAAYNDYESLSANRIGFVEPLRPALAAANSPLTEEQEIRLARIVGANTNSYQAKPTDIGTRRRMDWDAIRAEAGTVLTPAQMAVFQVYLSRWKEVIK